MIMEMFIITLVSWTLYRRSYEPVKLELKESENNLDVKLSLNTALDEEHAAWCERIYIYIYLYNIYKSVPFVFVYLYYIISYITSCLMYI